MKLKEAIEILIETSYRDLRGVGLGIERPCRSCVDEKRVEKAIERAWRYVHGEEMSENEKFNRGL